MQINVSQLLKEPIGSTRDYKVSETVDVTGDGTGSLVEGDVRLTRTNRGILVQGKLRTTVLIACSRCLCLFNCPVTLELEEEYFPIIDIVTGMPLPMPEPDYFTIDEHHILDLTEAIRQNALVAIPMKPLCREECAGLCAQCGQDLNEGPCDCPSPRIDSRWSKLVKLTSGRKSKKRKGTE